MGWNKESLIGQQKERRYSNSNNTINRIYKEMHSVIAHHPEPNAQHVPKPLSPLSHPGHLLQLLYEHVIICAVG